MLKFGLLIVLANIFLKIVIGIGLWKMAMEFKSGEGINSSEKYNEEEIAAGNPEILRGQNNNRRIFPDAENDKEFDLRQSEEQEGE